MNSPKSTNQKWQDLLYQLLTPSLVRIVHPRGMATRELIAPSVFGPIDMLESVISLPTRKLNYAFMAAEAAWMLSGSNRLQPLTDFCEKMSAYSDDGMTLAGAYGPMIKDQFEYVVSKLLDDPHTRQAVLTTWRPNPDPSKDIPCTISMQFMIRDQHLDTYVYMRSSDAWLGVPYDIFAFSMVSMAVLAKINRWKPGADILQPRHLYMLAGSRHLYEENWEAAVKILSEEHLAADITPPQTGFLFTQREELAHHLTARAVLIKNKLAVYP